MIFKSSEDVHQEKHIENATDQEDDRADYVDLRTTFLDVVLGSSEFCLLTRLANIIVSHLDVPPPCRLYAYYRRLAGLYVFQVCDISLQENERRE